MSIFDEFERFMKRWQKFVEEIERQIEEDIRRFTSSPPRFGTKPRVYYYGFEVTMGPDGKPIVREFGNVRKGREVGKIEIAEEVEPLTDVVEEEDKIKVVMEMPGVDKEDIRVYVSDDGKTLTVEAKGKERK